MSGGKLDGVEILLVFPCALGPPAVPGTITNCSRCGCACWLAPSSSKLLAQKPAIKIACVPCAGVIGAESEGPLLVDVVPDAEYRGDPTRALAFAKTTLQDLITARKREN